MTTLDLDGLVAIDVHTHAEISADCHPSLSPELEAGKAAYFKAGQAQPTIDELAEHYRSRRIAAVCSRWTPSTPPVIRRSATTRWPRAAPATPTS